MADETIGPYQLHFLAYQLADGRWDAFVSIDYFDKQVSDFRRLVERKPANQNPLENYEQAIEHARRLGNALVAEFDAAAAAVRPEDQ